MKPFHTHDCDRCIYLGSILLSWKDHGKHNPDMVDCYWCDSKGIPNMSSIIGRFGNEGSEYVCSLPPECFADGREEYFKHAERWYLFALFRATELGLYKNER